MNDNIPVQIRTEGTPAFPVGTGDTTPPASPAENKDPEETSTPAAGSDTTQPPADTKKELPFDQHPAWVEREQKWDKRFNEQEARHADEMQKIREEFGQARKENAANTEIPAWFGGTQEQWNAYRADLDKQLSGAEERAFKRFQDQTSAQDKLVKEATDYMQSEIKTIESDKEINPTGIKIDPNKLLKFVLDNDLVDSKGRWNYRAGFLAMGAKAGASKPNTGDRKDIAGATTSEPVPESRPAAFKTSEDFKKNRPW